MNNDEPTKDLSDGDKLDTSTTLTAIMKRFNELDDKLTTRMDNMSKVMQAEFADVNARLASIDSHIDKLDRKVDRLIKDVFEVRSDMDRLSSRVDDLESKAS